MINFEDLSETYLKNAEAGQLFYVRDPKTDSIIVMELGVNTQVHPDGIFLSIPAPGNKMMGIDYEWKHVRPLEAKDAMQSAVQSREGMVTLIKSKQYEIS